MDRSHQQQVILVFAKQLRKHAHRIPGHFDRETIHQWRTGFKRLRAFLRLISAGKTRRSRLVLPETKTVYRVAGNIRDLQLFSDNLQREIPDLSTQLPTYLFRLERQLFTAKEAWVSAWEACDFDAQVKAWLDCCPPYLTDEAIQRWLMEKRAGIRLLLLVPDTEGNLHRLRKLLKDIYYNRQIFEQHWGIRFPNNTAGQEKNLEQLTTALGEFNDRCVALQWLSAAQLKLLPSTELKLLKSLRLDWMQRKESLREALVDSLQRDAG